MTDLRLGDMLVLDDMPAKLLKALAVIADTLHPAFDRQPWIRAPGWSKQSCVLTSLTVRDFLHDIGFKDAKVYPCSAVMRAARGDADLHSLGIGEVPGQPTPPHGRWCGHMVVTVPSLRALIDTTLYQAMRPHWPMLPGMIATRSFGGPIIGVEVFGKHPFAHVEIAEDDYRFVVLWLDDRRNKTWQRGGDSEPWRRQVVTAALRDRFGDWLDG